MLDGHLKQPTANLDQEDVFGEAVQGPQIDNTVKEITTVSQ